MVRGATVKMSLYEDGSTIRPILEAKIENILKSDDEQKMVNRLVPFIRLVHGISSTRVGEERRDLNVLAVSTTSIYSHYYSFMISTNSARVQSFQDKENLDKINENAEKFVKAINEVSKNFLTDLKEIISTAGSKNRATELFENTYDNLVENILNIFTM